jgi:putative transposase
MVDYIDGHRDTFGVEPICKQLQFAPSTYYANKSRPLSARAIADAVMKVTLLALWKANYEVYGVRKMYKALLREGHQIGRDQVGRLMGELDIRGVRRGRKVRTTKADDKAPRPPDLVKRHFKATAPNQLWVTDLTYVPTWAGMVYVCFITDVFSRTIVGWRVATNMRTQMVLDSLEMARWSRGTRLEGLVCHSDAGSQGEFIRLSQHSMKMEVFSGSSSTCSRSGRATKVEIARSSTAPARN